MLKNVKNIVLFLVYNFYIIFEIHQFVITDNYQNRENKGITIYIAVTLIFPVFIILI